MVKAKTSNGSDFYKKQGFKPLIVHVSGKTHEKLSALASLEQRSLQLVARAILEQTAKDPEKALKILNEYIKAVARAD